MVSISKYEKYFRNLCDPIYLKTRLKMSLKRYGLYGDHQQLGSLILKIQNTKDEIPRMKYEID